MAIPSLDTICALATPSGVGALAILRVSGDQSFPILDAFFKPANKAKVLELAGHQATFGHLVDEKGILDEVLVTTFRNPRSFTGEDAFEVSCHASPYIIQKILNRLHELGARMAKPGEFTQRAFLNGRMDLSQAEAVADVIASENEAAHRVAMQQLRGGFSDKLKELRQEFIDFAALVELELDFSEEDVEFADRTRLNELLQKIESEVLHLSNSFATGQVIKDGIPVSIVGEPNVGKSTLLNALFQEEKALVSHYAGTTRDSIEDTLILDGLKFRFIDTAGIRETDDHVEKLGIARTFDKIEKSALVLYMIDLTADLQGHEKALKHIEQVAQDKAILVVLNKADLANADQALELFSRFPTLVISAKEEKGLHELRELLLEECRKKFAFQEEIVVTNARHQYELEESLKALDQVRNGMENNLSGEFVAMDIRLALEHLGNITGEIGSDELLGSIFSRFCIGK